MILVLPFDFLSSSDEVSGGGEEVPDDASLSPTALVFGDAGVAFPVTIGAARIDAGGGRVGDPCRGHDPQRKAACLHLLPQQGQRVGERIAAHALLRQYAEVLGAGERRIVRNVNTSEGCVVVLQGSE